MEFELLIGILSGIGASVAREAIGRLVVAIRERATTSDGADEMTELYEQRLRQARVESSVPLSAAAGLVADLIEESSGSAAGLRSKQADVDNG